MNEVNLISDPAWLTALKAIQLFLALVSNMFLLLDMTRKVRFTIAEPITIIGWYISAICLVCLHAIASGPLLNSLGISADEKIWSQAFYYGIWSAILYFVAASILVITFWGSLHGHYEEDFNLSHSQRTLMLQTMTFLTFLLLGALLFSKLEDWNYLDGVYWANVTLFTIGFGDIAPNTVLAQALLMPYALIGITSLGLVINSIRSMIVERGSQRLDARAEEQSRLNALRKLVRKGKGDMLTPLECGDSPADVSIRELERRYLEFGLMRAIQKRASSRRRWTALIISAVSWLCLWLCGAVVFYRCEKTGQGWTYFDAVYFCFVSFTTIGYGDLVPKSNAGKSFFVFWSLIALPILTILISNAGDTVIRVINDVTIRVGSITLLPGRGGFGHNMKQLLHQLSCGYLYSGSEAEESFDLEKRTARPRGTPEPRVSKRKGRDGQSHDIDNSTSKTLASWTGSPGSSRSHAPRQVTPAQGFAATCNAKLENLPTGDDLHFLLISEIQTVAKTIRDDRHRRYTFQDWAWYLRLIGEDERDPDAHREVRTKERTRPINKIGSAGTKMLHRQPSVQRHDEDDENQTERNQQPTRNNASPLKWSWVGNQSPLLSRKEESEWILERLLERLRELLWETSRQHQDNVVESS
ncbi:potassium channel, partial [Metarhizium brunneum ARSEF 3297]